MPVAKETRLKLNSEGKKIVGKTTKSFTTTNTKGAAITMGELNKENEDEFCNLGSTVNPTGAHKETLPDQ